MPTNEVEELTEAEELVAFSQEQNKALDGLETTIDDNQMLIESLAGKVEGGMEVPDFQGEATEAIKTCSDELYALED